MELPTAASDQSINNWTASIMSNAKYSFLVLAIVALAIIGIAVGTCLWKDNSNSVALTVMVLRSLQVSLAMLIGMTMVYLGVVCAWFGLAASVTVEGGNGNIQAKVATVSPGIILMLCGTTLLIVATMQKFTVDEAGLHIVGAPSVGDQPSDRSLIPGFSR